MRGLATLLGMISIPLALLNLIGGIIAGIWLAILGEWSAILLGCGILFVGAFAVSLLLVPGLGLAGMGVMAIERGNKLLGWLFILLASPWTYVVIIGWEVFIFTTFGKRVTADNMVPMWLWTYGAATGVWSYLASKEEQGGDGGGAVMMAFAAQVAFIVFSACQIWLGWSIRDSIIAMAMPLFLPLLAGLLTMRFRLSVNPESQP